nr:MAG TPA: hypothetical protein [Caudoviricetes sp.]
MLSHKFRLYLHPMQGVSHRTHLSHLVVEPSSIRGLAADFPLLKALSTLYNQRFYFSICHPITFFCFRNIHA